MPGSPLRSLLTPTDDETPPAAETLATVQTQASVATSRTSEEVAIVVGVPDGLVHVVVRGADPGTELNVSWTDQSSARVSAPHGSRFTYAEGRVEVDVSRGTIRVQLPRSAGSVALEVDGSLYLAGSAEAFEISGPAVEWSSDSIRFEVAG